MFRKKRIAFPNPHKSPYIKAVILKDGSYYEFDGVDAWRRKSFDPYREVSK